LCQKNNTTKKYFEGSHTLFQKITKLTTKRMSTIGNHQNYTQKWSETSSSIMMKSSDLTAITLLFPPLSFFVHQQVVHRRREINNLLKKFRPQTIL
jgi:hypothetical protein